MLALPALKDVFTEIEVWCWQADGNVPVDKLVKIPRWCVHRIPVFGYMFFSLFVTWRAWWLFKFLKKNRHDVIYTVANYFKDCDVCHVHFSQMDWFKQQKSLGVKSLRDSYERIASWIGLQEALVFWRKTSAKLVLSVSRSVADDILKINSGINVAVLPNSYDANRFNLSVKDKWRIVTRAMLGLNAQQTVFIFVSAGHYRRKGFFLAVEAIEKLRKREGCKDCVLLVVGGAPHRIDALQSQLNEMFSGWHEYVKFTGMVPDVEKYFAAADALLFPSYSEAFALVEVEAAACGLPLFLTRHHGSEMILEDGVNGRYIEFDVEKIADVLESFTTGLWKYRPSQQDQSLTKEAYGEKLALALASVGQSSDTRENVLSSKVIFQ